MTFLLSPLAAIVIASQPVDTAPPSLCEPGEASIINGTVEDNFGLDVAVCVSESANEDDQSPPRISIRWSGEGGGDVVSCIPSQCNGVIEYSRYSSPNLTILQLAWTKGGHVHRLYQTLDRSNLDKPAHGSTTHSWTHTDTSTGTVYTDSFPMRTNAAPLAMMTLERWLTPKSWTEPLLSPICDGDGRP